MSEDGQNLHALLIGIDHYPTSPLRGCVNDVEAIATWLEEHAKVDPERITRLVSSAKPLPTLAEIRAAFKALAKVKAGSRVFVYYSGHGAQEVRSGARLAQEALVPLDGWPVLDGDQRRLLWDYELNGLLGAIAANTYLTCVLDCCHSAGATRNDPFAQSVILRESAARSAVVPGTDPPPEVVRDQATGAWAEVVACEASEVAREGGVCEKGGRNGLFTRALLDALYAIPKERAHTVLWSEIWYSILERLGTWNPWQHPRQGDAWARPVLGGEPGNGDLGFRIEQRPENAYVVHAGAFAGIGEGTELAVYGREPVEFPPIDSAEDVAARELRVRVTKVRGAASDAIWIDGKRRDLPVGPRARVIVEAPSQRLAVRVEGDDKAIAAAIKEAVDRMRAVTSDDSYDVWCKRCDGTLVFGDRCYTSIVPGDARALVAPTVADSELGAVLEHLRRYVEPVRMAKRCRDLPNKLKLEVLDCHDSTFLASLTAEQLQDPPLDDVPTHDGLPEVHDDQRFCVRLRNTSREKLEVVALLCCTSDGAVQLWGTQLVPALGQATFWAQGQNGEPFIAGFPDGRKRVIERLVAIGTTVAGTPFGHLSVRNSLDQMISELRERGAADERDRGSKNFEAKAHPKPPERWTGVIQEVLFSRPS